MDPPMLNATLSKPCIVVLLSCTTRGHMSFCPVATVSVSPAVAARRCGPSASPRGGIDPCPNLTRFGHFVVPTLDSLSLMLASRSTFYLRRVHAAGIASSSIAPEAVADQNSNPRTFCHDLRPAIHCVVLSPCISFLIVSLLSASGTGRLALLCLSSSRSVNRSGRLPRPRLVGVGGGGFPSPFSTRSRTLK